MILGLPLIGTRSSRRSRYRQDASRRLRHRRLRPSQQSRDRSGLVKNLHPMSQSRKGPSTRGNEQMISVADFSIPVSDIEKSTWFYTEVLGWLHRPEAAL